MGRKASLEAKALLQEAVNDKVRCLTCERRCELADGQVGWCRTRQNRAGTLYTLIYGAVSSLSCNPIEKKPLYHFYPGSLALTAGAWSCNFACPWCQNWDISKQPPFGYAQGMPSGGDFIPPDEFVSLALRRQCQGTSISFNEPTLSLEWSLDVFPLAREAGLYNTFVTNGYMTEEALQMIHPFLDAANVDLKAFNDDFYKTFCKARLDPVKETLKRMKSLGIFIEVTTLIIPGLNDDKKELENLSAFLVDALGPETPWHISRFHPTYKLMDRPPTPVETLIRAREIGIKAGLKYVYTGNVPGESGEKTFCDQCDHLLIDRWGFYVQNIRIKNGKCPQCGAAVGGVWD